LNAAFDELPSTSSGPEPVERQARQSRNDLIADFGLIKSRSQVSGVRQKPKVGSLIDEQTSSGTKNN